MEMRLRSQRYNLVFRQAARIGGIFLILMSLIRFMFYYLAVSSFEIIEKPVLLKAFLIGFRFDLLVVGFALVPVAILGFVWFMADFSRPWFVLFCKIYFSVCWFLILLSSAISLPHYLLEGHHYRWGSTLYGLSFDLITTALLSLICLFMLASVLKTIWKHFEYPYPYLLETWKVPAPVEISVRLLIPILIVGMAARGSLGAHHLEKEDSSVSPWDNVNELALNSIWCINK